jgi:[ribosomal protein S18]-alanine N-acetyltransferase
MGLVIRTVKPGDLEQVHRIEKASFPDPYDLFLFQLLRDRAGEGFIVAESEGIVGYAVAEVRERQGHILSMAVSPDHRRQGIGDALLRELLVRLGPRAEEVRLEVREDNRPALKLYEAHGFRRTGEVLEHYYPGGESAIVMLRAS